jgi:hypothetical protein
LTADEQSYAERVAARGRGGPPELAGDTLRHAPADHLAAVAAEAWAAQNRLSGVATYDASYDTNGRGPADIAADVLEAWL